MFYLCEDSRYVLKHLFILDLISHPDVLGMGYNQSLQVPGSSRTTKKELQDAAFHLLGFQTQGHIPPSPITVCSCFSVSFSIPDPLYLSSYQKVWVSIELKVSLWDSKPCQKAWWVEWFETPDTRWVHTWVGRCLPTPCQIPELECTIFPTLGNVTWGHIGPEQSSPC